MSSLIKTIMDERNKRLEKANPQNRLDPSQSLTDIYKDDTPGEKKSSDK